MRLQKLLSQNSEDFQRASAVTDAETPHVLLSTMQFLIKGMTEMSQAMKKAQQDEEGCEP